MVYILIFHSSVVIFSGDFRLWLALPSGLTSSVFQAKIMYLFPMSSMFAIYRPYNFLCIKPIIQGQTEVTRRRRRRRKKLLDDLGGRIGYSHLKEEALGRFKWRNRF
jgi:hypothetical protein